MTDEDSRNEIEIEYKVADGAPGVIIIDSKITLKSKDSISSLIEQAFKVKERMEIKKK